MPTKVTSYDNNVASGFTQYYCDAGGNILRMYTGLSSPLTITGLDAVSGADTEFSVTKYVYDRFGNVTSITDALDQTESYTYDINGSVLTKTDRNGVVTEYTYDSLGRMISTEAGDEIITATYALTGLPRSESNGTATSTYTYDALGRVLTEVTNNQTKQYTYDLANNRKTYKLTAGGIQRFNTSYTYDNLSRLTGTSENGVTSAYTYDTNGNRASVTYNNGLSETYTYNLANFVTNVTNKKGASTLSSYIYTYNLDGNQRTKLDHTGKTTTYVYDGLGRLISESDSGGGANQTYAYTYDDSGNRLTLTATGADAYVTSYSYDLNNHLLEESKVINSTGAQVTTYTYDPNGNQLGAVKSLVSDSGGNSSLNLELGLDMSELRTYNELNQLVEVWSNGVVVSYEYYVNGLRYSKATANVETVFVLDGGNVVLETVDDIMTAKYIRAMNLVSSSIDGALSYYLYNAHGDVVQLTNSAGTVTKTYNYDAFGVEDEPDGSDSNPYRYCGEYWDFETNTYYLRARSYDPATGRFLSEDSYTGDILDPLSLNLYTYAHNNPIRYIDPSGHDPIPAWATRINAGEGTEEDYQTALSVDPDAWAGHANTVVKRAIKAAQERAQEEEKVVSASKAEKERPDSGLSDLSDEEISKRARDKSLSGAERRRYQKEEKIRGNRNKQKRGSKIEELPPEQAFEFMPDSKVELDTGDIVTAAAVTVGAVIVYEGVKWIVAAILAGPTGGISLIVAGAML